VTISYVWAGAVNLICDLTINTEVAMTVSVTPSNKNAYKESK
jgi:hypothetical protein